MLIITKIKEKIQGSSFSDRHKRLIESTYSGVSKRDLKIIKSEFNKKASRSKQQEVQILKHLKRREWVIGTAFGYGIVVKGGR